MSDDQHVYPNPDRPRRAVVSVALSREQFDAIADHCERHGLKVSTFMRDATLKATSPIIQVTVPPHLSTVTMGASVTRASWTITGPAA